MGGVVDSVTDFVSNTGQMLGVGMAYDTVANMINPPSGGNQTEVAKKMTTSTSVGNKLDATGKTYDPASEEEKKRKAVNKKTLGTRGLQIPLASDTSTTTSDVTASNTGIQI